MSTPAAHAFAHATTRPQIRKEVWYPDAPEVVWVALTDPLALAEWLMPSTFKPVLGHTFRFQCDPCFPPFENYTDCKVVELEPCRRMVWEWQMRTKPGKPLAQPFLVSFTLTPERGGTRLVLEQTEYHGPWGLFVRLGMSFGWGTMVKRWIPRVMKNVRNGRFEPGAIPRTKRCYKMKTVSAKDLSELSI